MAAAWASPGNASSPHTAGAAAAELVATARQAVAELIGAAPAEVVFTSGATEANNLAILGVARQAALRGDPRKRIVVSAIEHKAVLAPAHALAAEGFEIVEAPVGEDGVLDLAAFSAVLGPRTLLASVMLANNETGALQPVAEAAEAAHAAGALFHCDAAQAAGKVAIDVLDLDVDYLSLSAHKLYGPMGAGALYVSASAPRPAPLMLGGWQEQGLRGGTEPAPLLAGFGAAATVARARLDADATHGRRLAERLQRALAARQVRFQLTVGGATVVPGSLSIRLHNISAEDIVQKLARSVCVSTGSACNYGQVTASHVLRAMRLSEAQAATVLRIFCSRYNTDAEIHAAALEIAAAVAQLSLAPGEPRQ